MKVNHWLHSDAANSAGPVSQTFGLKYSCIESLSISPLKKSEFVPKEIEPMETQLAINQQANVPVCCQFTERLPALIRIIVLLAVTLLFTGCAITYNIKKDELPTSSSSALVQQWPLTVGVFAPPSLKSLVIAKNSWRVPAGDAAVSTFQWALAQMFTNIIEIDVSPSEGKIPNNVAGVVVLSNISYTYSSPTLLHYEIELYSPKGKIIKRWSLAAQGLNWDIKESSLSSLMQSKGSELTYCIRDITAQFMVNFSRSPEVHSWLASEGIVTSKTVPVFKDKDTITEKASVVLLVSNMDTWLHTDALRGMDCVGHRIGQMAPPVKVMPMDTVRIQFFPWLEISTAPKTVEETQRWLSEPAIQQKARALGARYLLEFHGGTNTNWNKGIILCGAGFGRGGCFGFSWGDRNSSFSATILDMWTGDKMSDATATQSGKVYMPAYIVPIPIVAPTEQKACEELSQKIHRIVASEQP